MMNFLFMLVSLFIIRELYVRVEAQQKYVGKGCEGSDNGTQTDESYYRQSNLIHLRYNLSFEASLSKFYNVTIGDPPYILYGLFQCREDLDVDNCRTCVGIATEAITAKCPSHAEAIVWYKECMVRYTNRPILSTCEISPSCKKSNASYVSNNALFPEILVSAMDILINFTVSQSLHFAASKNILTSPNQEELYSFAQCTRNINTLGCNACLRMALSQMRDCCSASKRAMVFLPSCQLRYDNMSFWSENMPLAPTLATLRAPPLAPPPAPQLAPPLAPPHAPLKDPALGEKQKRKEMIIGVFASATLIGAILLIAGLWLCRHRTAVGNDIVCPESLQFNFKNIKAATRNFSERNKLGQGGFGVVYKGTLTDGSGIAVKRLSRISNQGTPEFQNEVQIVANLQHLNLVKLLGYCISKKEQVLVYELLSNSSLDRFLNDRQKRASLGWELRLKIIGDIARGLSYLHEGSRLKIIHRDLKPSNILLDEAMNAKIADFGLAKLFDSDQSKEYLTKVAGSYGYMAPEYALTGRLSVKCDVYSFGVIVLEMVSGQRSRTIDQQTEEGIICRAWRLWNEGSILELVDPLLNNVFVHEEVKSCVLIALLCIQEDPTLRPRMSSVVSALSGEPINRLLPNAPHYLTIADPNDATSFNTYALPWVEIQRRALDNSTGTLSTSELYAR